MAPLSLTVDVVMVDAPELARPPPYVAELVLKVDPATASVPALNRLPPARNADEITSRLLGARPPFAMGFW
jgi:hypothetical protein